MATYRQSIAIDLTPPTKYLKPKGDGSFERAACDESRHGPAIGWVPLLDYRLGS